MTPYGDPLRLIGILALTAAVIWASWRTSRRINGGANLGAAVDAALLTFLIQYLAVGIPGILGILNPWTIAAMALALCAIVIGLSNRLIETPRVFGEDRSNWAMIVGGFFLAGYVGAFAWISASQSPAAATDVLVYHLPAAAQWLATHHLGYYPTWFFNPANTYSPLGGSIFIEWWMAPLLNDALARFVQIPAIALLWLAAMLLMRQLGAGSTLAAILATATVLARPFLSQSVLPKDDLLLVAFFAVAVSAMDHRRLAGPFGALRLGIAVGLMLSIKYTAILGLIPLLLMIDSPFRALCKPRHFARTILCIVLLAGPWYLRNWIFRGNPVYPMDVRIMGAQLFHGPLTMSRSLRLASWPQVWNVITETYFGIPPIVAIAFAGLWFLSLVCCLRKLAGDPLRRAVILGPALCLAVFAYASPFAEVRFIFPALLLIAVSSSLVLAYRDWPILAIGVSVSLCFFCVLTDFEGPSRAAAKPLIEAGFITAIAASAFYALRRAVRRRGLLDAVAITVAVLVPMLLIFAYWHDYLETFRQRMDTRRYSPADDGRWALMDNLYGVKARLWWFIRQQPENAAVAFANFPETYALRGFDLDRPVVYCPLSDVGRSQSILPPLADDLPPHLPGELLDAACAADLNRQVDKTQWLQNLARAEVRYLVIYVGEGHPPELQLAQSDRSHFRIIYDASENQNGRVDRGVVYQIMQP